jgi:hypothetical protein
MYYEMSKPAPYQLILVLKQKNISEMPLEPMLKRCIMLSSIDFSHLIYLFALECPINFRQWERIAVCRLLPFIPKPTRNLQKKS